jgi:hypothetical protein
MAEIEGRVYRIEFNANAKGTGFLIGPDRVLTNYHVMKGPIDGKFPPEQVACRFDCKVLADGSCLDGLVVGLHSANWRIDDSPYSPAERDDQPDRELPTLDQLDYAVLQRERPVGKELGGQAKFGSGSAWVDRIKRSASFGTRHADDDCSASRWQSAETCRGDRCEDARDQKSFSVD